MSDVISLRAARKAKSRTEKDKHATQNRTLHGRTKAEKLREKKEKERVQKLLDGHKMDEE